MKQTAVEYLVGLLETQKFITKSQIFISQEMEKEQIKDAYYTGNDDVKDNPDKEEEQYYNETFKSK